MTAMRRALMAALVGVLAGGVSTQARAQIEGMPLFTNPSFGTGARVHADLGLPTDKGTSLGDYKVVQGGVTLAIGPLGLGANVGMTNSTLKWASSGNPTPTSFGSQNKWTVSALAQFRLMGGGLVPLSLSLFGGASYDVSAYSFSASAFTSLPVTVQNQIKAAYPQILLIPVGAAIGLKVPVLGLSVWGAPRLNLRSVINCPSGQSCPSKSDFRWAVGADLPLFFILAIRAAYDSGKIAGQTVNHFGLGASIGLGGMH
jgi:hypothetical protein